IRSATLYDRSGNAVAHAGAIVPSAALVCRSLVDGGSLCIEPSAVQIAALRRRVAMIAGIALGAGALIALMSWFAVRARIRDLRAPLGSIAGFAQALAEDDEKLDDNGREYVFWIRESAKQMAQLIEGLLQMARYSSAEVKRGDVDLSKIARGIAGTLQRSDP